MNGHQDTGAPTSSRELAADVMQLVQRLVGLEIALAKQELKEIAIRNLIAVACLAVAALLAILTVLVAVPVLIVELVPWHWQAAAVWAAVYGLVAGGLALYGKSRFSLRMPSRTIESLKENKEWALHQLRSTKR